MIFELTCFTDSNSNFKFAQAFGFPSSDTAAITSLVAPFTASFANNSNYVILAAGVLPVPSVAAYIVEVVIPAAGTTPVGFGESK